LFLLGWGGAGGGMLQLLNVNNQFLSLLWGRFLLALRAQKRVVGRHKSRRRNSGVHCYYYGRVVRYLIE